MAQRGDKLPSDTSAAAQVVGFIVAGAIFLASIGAVLVTTQEMAADPEPLRHAGDTLAADSLADLVVGSPGLGWDDGADDVDRLGILNENGSGLSPEALESMRGAMYAADPDNEKVDYEEAKVSLGLEPDGPEQFHIRVYPLGLEPVYDASVADIQTLYVGDWLTLSSVVIPDSGTSEEKVVAANQLLNATMVTGVSDERLALRAIGLDFNDRIYLGAGNPTVLVDRPFPLPDLPWTETGAILEGDVLPDIKTYIDLVMVDKLRCTGGSDRCYDLLVVGSGVSHNALLNGQVRQAVADFVMAGGTLVVLGSGALNFAWLEPLLSAGISTVNGAATAPDSSHPLLNEPNDLNWASYRNFGLGWDIKAQGAAAHYDDFSHVIVQGGEDILAVSRDGSFGEGRVLLTTFRPLDIASLQGLKEAMDFLENIVLYHDRTGLFLEYGPTAEVPSVVSLAVRTSHIWDERLGQVPVRVEVHTWVD